MDEYLICGELFCESTPEGLKELTQSGEAGFLLYATKIPVLSSEELNKILNLAWIEMGSSQSHDIPGFNLSPFVEDVEIYDDATEYHFTSIKIYSLIAACKLWDTTRIAKALNDYEKWFRSSDAKLDSPTNRVCVMLCRCVAEATLLANILLSQGKQPIQAEKPTSADQKTLEDRYAKKSEDQIAFDKATQIFCAAILGDEKVPSQIDVARQLCEEGVIPDAPAFAKKMSKAKVFTHLRNNGKKRPPKTSVKAYEKWRNEFIKLFAPFAEPLIQSNHIGMEEPKKAPTHRAKKKVDDEHEVM